MICALRADGSEDDTSSVTAEVVARVTSAVRFHGMADFQYVSTDTRRSTQQASRPDDPPGLEPEPMLFPPQLFTKQDVPLDYAFRSFYAGDPDWMLARAGQRSTHSCQFHDNVNLQVMRQALFQRCAAQSLYEWGQGTFLYRYHVSLCFTNHMVSWASDGIGMCAGTALGRSVGRLAAHVISFQAVNILQPLGEEAGKRLLCF